MENILAILITGCSSGLGFELAKTHIELGDSVYGISRSLTNLELTDFLQVDFKQDNAYNKVRQAQFLHYAYFTRVYLNAGELGSLKPIDTTTPEEISDIINSSVLGNKQILDILLKRKNVERVCWTSSGAAEKAYAGMSLYCLVKAMNLQLARGYQEEFPDIKFHCVNPGPFQSKMQEEIRSYDPSLFPSLNRFHELEHTFPPASSVANMLIKKLDGDTPLSFNMKIGVY